MKIIQKFFNYQDKSCISNIIINTNQQFFQKEENSIINSNIIINKEIDNNHNEDRTKQITQDININNEIKNKNDNNYIIL